MRNSSSFDLEFKEVSEEGSFEGIASIFNKVDHGGDMILPGAYAETIKDMKAQNRVIPFLWRHREEDVIGGVTHLEERKEGLFVQGTVVPSISEVAKKAYSLMKAGLARSMSIGYIVPQGGATKSNGVRKISKLDLMEISFVPVGMDPFANMTDVKSLSDIRGRLAAGDLLSEREWELLLKENCNLTNAEAERAIRVNLKKGLGDPVKANNEAAEILKDIRALIKT